MPNVSLALAAGARRQRPNHDVLALPMASGSRRAFWRHLHSEVGMIEERRDTTLNEMVWLLVEQAESISRSALNPSLRADGGL
jgi:hypothetical protein